MKLYRVNSFPKKYPVYINPKYIATIHGVFTRKDSGYYYIDIGMAGGEQIHIRRNTRKEIMDIFETIRTMINEVNE